MRLLRSLVVVAVVLTTRISAAEPPKIFEENFDTTAVGKLPAGLKIFAGGFTVQQDGGKTFLELPGAPLDTFGVLFGPSQKAPAMASVRIFGTKTGRKFPAFGLSLGGAGGYRLQVSAAKGTLELFKGDAPQASVPYTWTSGHWTVLRLQVRPKADGTGATIEGKAWPADAAEPAEWQVRFDAPDAPPAGMAGIWGNPFSGTPIRYDDLVVATPSTPD